MLSPFKKLIELWGKYERRLSVGSMVVGFCFDLIIAKRPDSVYDNVLLLSYLIVSALCILVINRQKERFGYQSAEPLFLLLVMQFCFGGLSSNLLVLYGKSGLGGGEALFVVLLFSMLIGNEFLRTRYGQLRLNLAIYYLLLLTYLTVAAPTFIFHAVGALEFLASTAMSLAVIAIFMSAIYYFSRSFKGSVGKQHLVQCSSIIGVVCGIFIILYFFNFIPPVPLSLKDIGIYHDVTHASGQGYDVSYEAPSWYAFWEDTNPIYHAQIGDPAYCFSSVFAPTGLSTPVSHVWQWLDPTTNTWQDIATISFPIDGGRSAGYEGYSLILLPYAGEWRCDVETSSNQLIGRTTFSVSTSTTPVLKEKTI